MPRPIIALTAGDVAGIGPEIVLRACHDDAVNAACRLLVICHPEILLRAAVVFSPTAVPEIVSLDRRPTSADELRQRIAESKSRSPRAILCLNPAGDAAATAPARVVTAAAGDAAFQYLTAAIELAQSGTVDAIATAPLNKAALHEAGHHYPGHTEILAEKCGVSEFGMMLYLPGSRLAPLRELILNSTSPRHRPPELPATNGSDSAELPSMSSDSPRHCPPGLPVVHVTLHNSIASVPGLLTREAIVEKIHLMHDFLDRMGCERKAIGVCALNPHAGEEGLFGDEEGRVIEPAVRQLRYFNARVVGPLPVDTLMRRAVAGEFDGVVAMYHDQGHIPIKLIGFDSAVNITLGLPIVRTSPTHGTAFDRAWNPVTPADPAGMIEAILTAAKLCQ